jgi:hypothetical protein
MCSGTPMPVQETSESARLDSRRHPGDQRVGTRRTGRLRAKHRIIAMSAGQVGAILRAILGVFYLLPLCRLAGSLG